MLLPTACAKFVTPGSEAQPQAPRRFFSDASFWNTPIPKDAVTDPRSYHFMNLLSAAEGAHFVGLNYKSWTVPVYVADASTPRGTVRQRTYTREQLLAHRPWWLLSDFPLKLGDFSTFYGLCRGAGVPLLGGLVMYDEVKKGEIRHKLSACTSVNAYQEYVYPAIWTDGQTEGGLPEGAVIQLDPDLDLSTYHSLPGELAVARALQRYGVVIVDTAGDFAIYAEGLYGHPGKSWDRLFSEDGLARIPAHHYRVLKMDKIHQGGSARIPKLEDHRRSVNSSWGVRASDVSSVAH